MILFLKKYGIIGLLGLAACQSNPSAFPNLPQERSFLYPTLEQRDIQFLCTSVYQIPQFKSKPFVQSATPELLIVTETTVTLYFSNDYTQKFVKPKTVQLPSGIYPCS